MTMFRPAVAGVVTLFCVNCATMTAPGPAHPVVVAAVSQATAFRGGAGVDRASVGRRRPLTDANGAASPITITLAYTPEEHTLAVVVDAPSRPQRTDLFIDAGTDLLLDRPAQFTFDDRLSAAQARHNEAAEVATFPSDTGQVQEWRIDLGALGLTALGEPTLIGFDLEVRDAEGGLHQWGEKSHKWLNDRRLRRLSLMPAGAAFGEVRGTVRWASPGAASPPQRVTVERSKGGYKQLIDVDPDTGRFTAALPEGTYLARAFDTRTSTGLASVRSVRIRRHRSTDVGPLVIRRPTGLPLETLIRELMAAHNIRALAISYVRNGQVAFEQAFGVYPDGSALDSGAVFKMASVSKPVATMAVLSLVARGAWSLDAPLADDWIDPDIADDPRAHRITTRMALTHTTGLPNHRSGEGLRFLFDPGTRQSYSGEGLTYVRRALEAHFGKPFQQIAEEEVFAPAGMTQSSFQGPKTDAERYVHKFHNDYRFSPPNWDEATVKGGLMTTPRDLSRFMLWTLAGAGLPDELWAAVTARNDAALLDDRALDFTRYGLGWVVNGGAVPILSHGGSEFGARAYMVLLPGERTGLAVAANATGAGPAIRAILEATLMRDRRLPAIDAALARAESFDW